MAPGNRARRSQWISRTQRTTLILAFPILVFLFFALFLARFGTLTPDDGVYLNYGRLFYRGAWPYSDFFCAQGPLVPIIYGLPQVLFGPGIEKGRILVVLVGLLNIALAGRLAFRFGGGTAMIATVALLTTNPALINYQVKTQVITACMLLLWATAWSAKRPDHERVVWSVMALAGASLVRITMAPLLVLFLAWLILKKYFTLRISIHVTVILVLCFVLPFLPVFLSGSVGNAAYSLIGFQAGRGDDPIMAWSPGNFLSVFGESVRYLLAFIVLAGMRLASGRIDEWPKHLPIIAFFGAAASGVYFLTPSIFWFGYLLGGIPLLAVFAGCSAGWIMENIPDKSRKIFICGLTVLIAGVGFSQIHSHIYAHIERAERLGGSPVYRLGRVADLVRKHCGNEAMILAFETGIAAQGGFSILPGTEAGELSYAPQFPTDICRKRKLVNDAMLREAIVRRVPDAIAFADPDFAMLRRHRSFNHPGRIADSAAKNLPLIDRNFILDHYRFVGSIRNAGAWDATVHVFARS